MLHKSCSILIFHYVSLIKDEQEEEKIEVVGLEKLNLTGKNIIKAFIKFLIV